MTTKTKYWRMSQRMYYTIDDATVSVFALSLSQTCVRNGVGLRGWQDLIASGANATTPLTGNDCSEEGYIPGNVSLRYQPPGAPLQKRGAYGWLTKPTTLYTPTAMPYSSVSNQALAKFYSEINKVVSGFYAGPFLGEIRETISMLRRPLGAIREHLDRYLNHVLGYVNGKPVPKRHRPKKKQSISSFRKFNQAEKLEVIGNTWLEVRFGMLPLIKDVNEFLKSIGELVDVDQVLPVVSWAESVDKNYFFQQRQELHNALVRLVVTEKATGSVKVRFKGAVRVKASAPGLKGWFQNASHLGPRDFVPTLVELCPFSWLADYFLNVSDVINSIFVDTSPLSWYCRTIRRSVFHDVEGVVDAAAMKAYLQGAYKGSSGSPGFTRIRTSHVIRDVPVLGLVVPAFNFPDFPPQFMNMAALVIKNRSVTQKLVSLSS